MTTSGELVPDLVLSRGRASGEVLVLDEPLSFWGGVDPTSGRITDRRHPQLGAELGGRVLVLPGGRGSSSSSTVLCELLRNGNGPRAVVLGRDDPIIGLGAAVARELYGTELPVLVLGSDAYRRLVSGQWVEVDPDGRVLLPSEGG